MASTGAFGTTAYRSPELPRDRTRSAHLLAALEEDSTGRQPVHFAPSNDSSKPRVSESIDSLVHVFLDAPEDAESAIGYASVNLANETAELAMRPDSFERVTDLARGVWSHFGVERFWAKGRESAAAGLEAQAVRSLEVMTLRLPGHELASQRESDIHIRPFNPTSDTSRWLQINAEIFADLPDQANVTRDELASLMKEEWFDPAGFLVAESALAGVGRLTGFHWTKVDPTQRFRHRVSGEVFVLGVLPKFTGTGLAAALLHAGLQRINSLGVRNVHLFVESDNERAHSFYESQGFSDADRDQLLRLDP